LGGVGEDLISLKKYFLLRVLPTWEVWTVKWVFHIVLIHQFRS